MEKKLLISFLFVCAFLKGWSSDIALLKSPDGGILFRLFTENNGLAFSVRYKNIPVINNSPLVLSLNQVTVTDAVKAGTAKAYAINENYSWMGAHAVAHNQCNGAKIPVTRGSFSYTIDVRVFNDGVAFRLALPGQADESRVPDEATLFNLPDHSTLWYHDLEMHYESVHVKKEISQVQKGEWVAPPATFKLPQGFYACITEADLENYSGMALQANGKNGLQVSLANNQPTSYPYRLRYSAEDTLRLKQPAHISGTITTPWRVILIGGDLNALVNSDIVSSLNPSPDPKLFAKGLKTGWIKPGRAVWKYLNGGGDGTLEVMKHFTDGAAALGFEHNILEGFWSRWKPEEIRELVNYSRQKGVGIWFWKHSKSLRNPAARDSFFRMCHDYGVTGVKIDFFDHEAKEVIDLYESILRETAQYHLLVDFHGANKPSGQARTYPNEMVREAVKGMESSKLMDRATHETTLPFTRFLAGPAEYTVLHFGERRRNTTWAHQIASAAILSAPLLTYAAHPDTILANPAANIIKSIPATWDETIVLPPSEIGQLAVYARRNGRTWFLAVMNGVEPRKIKVPLLFLNGSYQTELVKDNPAESASVLIEQKTYSSNDVLNLDLGPGGGFIARFSK
jgi:alpha-glucosidase